MKLRQKKGLLLSQAFGAVLTLILVAVLVIVSIYLFSVLSGSFSAGSAEQNATKDMITEFGDYPTLIGLVGTIIFLALVIGVLVSSFIFDNKQPI